VEPLVKPLDICLLGFGEVGQALAPELRARAPAPCAWDLAFADAGSAPSRAAIGLDVLAAPDAKSAVKNADLVISAVTAAQAGEAARSVAPHLKAGAYYFDLNSCSPATRLQAAETIEAAGGRFVEAAVMSPIAPRNAATPMLLGGAHAANFLSLAAGLGFSGATVFSGKLGAASAAKMCRSVIVKGLEALMLESLLTARTFGVEQAVLESLESLPLENWRTQSRYMISRALIHGARRAEEMREAAETVAQAGFPAAMSEACADWQEWASLRSSAAPVADLDKMLEVLVATRSREVAA
jgi:3-hydroxyisobutyrate dehydrogenase-like beta-hydroxyacid dehydrogenase